MAQDTILKSTGVGKIFTAVFSGESFRGKKLKHIPKAVREKLHKSTEVSTNHEFIIKQ